jgi:hypothetical protein
MKPTNEEIIQAHKQRLARRRAKRNADLDYQHSRERAWRHSPSGKASLARKRAKDAERAKAKKAEYEAALQQVTATAEPPAQPSEQPTKVRTFLITVTEL